MVKEFKSLKVKGDTWTYEEKKGHLIENKYGIEVFAYKEYNTWLVADGETGLNYSVIEKTLKGAKLKLEELFNKIDFDIIKTLRDGQLKSIKDEKVFI
jgi:hypothetical protein